MNFYPSKPDALKTLFGRPKPLIGTVHCEAFPGTPRYKSYPISHIIERALQDATTYVQGGMDGLIIENHGDLPFLRPEDIGPEIVATMAVVTQEVAKAVDVPFGINLLANGACSALAVAKATGARFIRVNQWVNAYVANEGFVQGESARALRYRKSIGAEDVFIFSDVHVKHGSHAIVADRSLEEQTLDAEFFDADVLIATGQRTGNAAVLDELRVIKEATTLPVVVGSGFTMENTREILRVADGAIVASSLKEDGNWWNPVSTERVKRLMGVVTGT
jgi:membrane complex biogenesis BtpA family protein